MSSIYLIRHGQAGTRQEYDALSEKGRIQARRLGEYLAAQRIAIGAVVSGSLRRQRETADEACRACRAAGGEFPERSVDDGWNEFDLDTVYRDVGPALAAADADFRQRYAELMRQATDEAHPVHHSWSPCDAEIVAAWIEGRHSSSAEPWDAFVARVRRCVDTLPDCGPGGGVAVFTSAVPVAISVAQSLGVANGRTMRLAGVMYNSAITTLRRQEDGLALFSFNGIPHLPEPELRTFR